MGMRLGSGDVVGVLVKAIRKYAFGGFQKDGGLL